MRQDAATPVREGLPWKGILAVILKNHDEIMGKDTIFGEGVQERGPLGVSIGRIGKENVRRSALPAMKKGKISANRVKAGRLLGDFLSDPGRKIPNKSRILLQKEDLPRPPGEGLEAHRPRTGEEIPENGPGKVILHHIEHGRANLSGGRTNLPWIGKTKGSSFEPSGLNADHCGAPS
jgi:hypothetical protein